MTTAIIATVTFLIGIVLAHFIQKANSVSRKVYEKAKEEIGALNNQLSAQQSLAEERATNIVRAAEESTELKRKVQQMESALAQASANLESKTDSETELKGKVNAQESKVDDLNKTLLELKAANSTLVANNHSLNEKLDTQKQEIEELGKKSLKEFENLANKIFDEKASKFSESSKENLDQILNPLKENLKDFKKKVEETYDKESKERFSLQDRIKELVELNQQISKDASNLTNALKGQAKTQGNWGEMILESILEHSGLTKDREYVTQESYRDENGKRKQPDVVIKYPNDRHIIIDSKVSLTAYERFANCDDVDEQQKHLKEHIRSVYNHIDNLSAKEYDKIDKSLDFVMLFVPIEPAYMTAIHYDQNLWSYAYKKRVLLISPTNLIAALKMVADIWKREHQNANALEIANRGEKLYDKFVGFIDDMKGVENALAKASTKHNDAFRKLHTGHGNLIGQAETLKNMGLNPKKSIPKDLLTDNEEVKKIN